LEGINTENKVRLSTFDGAHAFLFEADIRSDSLIGTFRSGSHWIEEWISVKDESADMPDMKQLTYLKDADSKLAFTFINEKGDSISLSDERYRNKVVIVQIMGTWCPNCMDETRFLTDMFNKYEDQGLEIIALDFEPKPTYEFFKPRAERFKNDLGVNYEVLLAGPADKKSAAESLPMLNHILAYPTAIFLNRKGEIVEIHTGFSGPGTGSYYRDYIEETEDLIKRLLAI
jgi:thiol-disulfide isomerase/thioredoxin